MARRRTIARRVVAAVLSVVLAAVIVIGALAMLTVTGYLPLNRLEGRVAEAVQERLGKAWQISVSRAGLTRQDGQSMLVAENLVLRHPSGFAMRAPEGAFSYDPLALLRGKLQLNGVDLKGLSLSVAVDASGAVELRSDESSVRMPVHAEVESAAPLALALALADEIFQSDGQLSWLNQARIRDASLVLIGPDGTRRTGLSQVNVQFYSSSATERRVSFSGVATNGRKQGELVATSTGVHGRNLTVALRDIDPADVLPLAIGDGTVETSGLKGALVLKATRADQADAPVLAEGQLSLGRGTLAVPSLGIEPFVIDALQVTASTGGGSRVTTLSEAIIRAGATQLKGSGSIDRLVGPDWRANLTFSGQVRGEGTDPPVLVDRIDLVAGGDGAAGLTLERFAVRAPTAGVEGSAALQQLADGPALKAKVRTNAVSETRALIALWPPFVSPQIRTLLTERLDAGQIHALDLAVDLDPAAYQASMAMLPIPDASVLATVIGHGTRFRIAAGLPPLADASVVARATGRTLTVTSERARAEISRQMSLALSDGHFTIADTYAPRTEGRASFRTTGGVDALATLLALPALKEFAPTQVDPQSLKGNVDLKTSIVLPLAEDLRASEVIVSSAGSLSHVASDTLFAPEKFDNGQFALTYERNVLAIKGDARVSGQAAQVDVRQSAKGHGEAIVMLTLDQAARQRRGLSLDGKLTGPVGLKVTKTLTPAGDGPIRIEADLGRSGIAEGLIPGWSKPAGRAGRVSFVYDADKDGVDLADFLLESAPVLLRGSISLTSSQDVEKASFTQARLSPGDDLKVELRREGNGYKASIRGAVMDVRPFMRTPPDGKGPDSELDIDLALPILTGHGSEQITNATLKLSRRNGEVRSLAFEGRMGRSPLSIRTGTGDTARQIVIQAADGGGLMRFFDYYRRAYGGDFALTLTPAGGGYRGSVLFRDFVVRNEPALRRVLAETQNAGTAATDLPQSGPTARNAGSEVQFTKLRGEFTRVGQRFDLRDTVIWGPLVGFTMQGQVDYQRDRMDLAGTFIPSYAFNNAFSQVPVLGRILGGGQYEGLFAVNFRLTGTANNPSLTINPLSAIAPGILRRFVDPFGGGTGPVAQ